MGAVNSRSCYLSMYIAKRMFVSPVFGTVRDGDLVKCTEAQAYPLIEQGLIEKKALPQQSKNTKPESSGNGSASAVKSAKGKRSR